MTRPTIEKPDIDERGGMKDGQPQRSSRRLFMQLLAFANAGDADRLTGALSDQCGGEQKLFSGEPDGARGVLYTDVNDPHGVALLTMHESPEFFVSRLRPFLNREPFRSLTLKGEYTMFGRTYSLGYEPDLEETLFTRPRNTALNARWPWAVWYPLRRSGRFQRLLARQQRAILMEHGVIGRSFGEADYAHDIRLACAGLDKADNDFVVGLVGKHLHPLSAIVQAMRKTQQTSLYLERLGPFFVGKAVWRSE